MADMNAHAAAEYLGVSERTIRNYFREGKIQHVRLSSRIVLTSKEWIDDFIERSTHKPTVNEKETEQND